MAWISPAAAWYTPDRAISRSRTRRLLFGSGQRRWDVVDTQLFEGRIKVDLTLFTALFDVQIVAADSLAEMIGNPREVNASQLGNDFEYGLGIMISNRFAGRNVEGLVGHEGWTPGYVTLVAHAPDTGMTAFWVPVRRAGPVRPERSSVALGSAHRSQRGPLSDSRQ